MHRRSLLTAVCAFPVLAGCTTSTPATPGISSDAVAKLSALTNGLLSIAGTEATILGATPAQAAQIAADAKLAQTALAVLQPGLATLTAMPSVQTIVSSVNNVLSMLAPVASALPSPVGQIVLALEVLLPVAEMSAGLTPPAGAKLGAAPMSPAAAQALLSAAH